MNDIETVVPLVQLRTARFLYHHHHHHQVSGYSDWLRAGQFDSHWGLGFFSSPPRPDRVWGPQSPGGSLQANRADGSWS